MYKLMSAVPAVIRDIIDGNIEWINNVRRNVPDFFDKLKVTHTPDILYIGCSDARLPVTLMTGKAPGKLFVGRNVGNQVTPNDHNLMAAIEYAVKALNVKHVVVCGHQSCGAVAAAHDGVPNNLPAVGKWIKGISDLKETFSDSLSQLPKKEDRLDALSKINIRAQMTTLEELPLLKEYTDVSIHGLFASLDGTPLSYLEGRQGAIRSKL